MRSKYYNLFQEVGKLQDKSFELIGNCLIVEKLPPEEIKSASGLIMAKGNQHVRDGLFDNLPAFYKVLLVGSGYYDDDGKTVPLNVQPGDIVLMGQHSVRQLSTFGPIVTDGTTIIGLAREEDISLRFIGEEGYEVVCALLSSNMYNKHE